MNGVQGKPRVVDAPDIREVYSDTMISAHFNGSALIFTLGVARPSPEEPVHPQTGRPAVVAVNNRIALSTHAAIELMQAIGNVLRGASATRAAGAPAASDNPARPAAPESTLKE